MTTPRIVSVLAPAKVNLFLHVVGKRADGYHLLESLIAFASHGDQLELEGSDRLSLATNGPFAGLLESESMATDAQAHGAENLVLRAARMLAERAGIQPRAAIRLEKRLPVAAGLGGGSADAAAALKGLCRLWEITPARADLMELAEALGADVPICLDGRPALVTGIGETIQPVEGIPEIPAVLINPGIPLSTADCFGARDAPFSPPGETPEALRAEALNDREPDQTTRSLTSCLTRRRNDLEAPARQLAPQIDHVINALGALPRCRLARMSGSGASCFGLFDDRMAAEAAAAEMSAVQPEWWVVPTVLGTTV